MSIYQSDLWLSDLNEVIRNDLISGDLAGKSVLITGAGGLICSAITDILIAYNETRGSEISIFAAGRSEERMRARFGAFFTRDYFHFVPYDATDPTPPCFSDTIDFVIHGASNSTPEKYMEEPVETMTSNISGLLSLFHLAQKVKTQRILYISSSEVYGKKEDGDTRPFSEDSYGFIDCLNPRSSYPIAKRAAEALCVAASNEFGIESVIVRPGHIYGPTASAQDTRVASAWSYAAAQGNDIVMKSDGLQLRSYCHCLDCATAVLTVLLRGKNKEAYNISNRDSIITIKQLGEMIAKAGEVSFIREEASLQEKKAFNPMNNSSLKSDKLESLGWKGVFDAEKGIEHTVKVLRDTL